MWLVSIIADVLFSLYKAFRALADAARDIPLIGGWCADKFEDIAWWFNDLQYEVVYTGGWFEEVRSSLLDLLNWDTAYQKVKDAFFGGTSAWDWWERSVWYWVDNYLPWLRDPETNIWDWLKPKVEALIPIDAVKPWEVWDLIVDKVKELIPVIPEIEIPSLEDIGQWFKDHFPTLSDIDLDPMGWLSEKMGDALARFFQVASWPFLRSLEAFLFRVLDEEEKE